LSKQKVKVEKDNNERYLLTYGDLMNLLLIFFIILYSMSQVDAQKFQQLSSSFKSTFGDYASGKLINQGGGGTNIVPSLNPSDSSTPTPTASANGSGLTAEEKGTQEVKQKVEQLITQQNLQGNLEVELQERGVVISITANLLFASGSADIEKDSLSILDKIGNILLAVPGNNIRIEGHTDNDPIKTSLYPSNWELSSARATNVLRRLVDNSGIKPNVISSVGYGEFRPKVPNISEANKAANRRVDIVIIKSIYDATEPTK
jgi:chemotaxis protein MotB